VLIANRISYANFISDLSSEAQYFFLVHLCNITLHFSRISKEKSPGYRLVWSFFCKGLDCLCKWSWGGAFCCSWSLTGLLWSLSGAEQKMQSTHFIISWKLCISETENTTVALLTISVFPFKGSQVRIHPLPERAQVDQRSASCRRLSALSSTCRQTYL